MVSLKHISTLATFNQTKFSADSTDSSYFLGSDQTQIFQGTPDVKYNDLCYIKCSNLQYTHGHLYGSTEVGEAHVSLTQEEYDALSEEEKNNGKIYFIKDVINPDDLTVSGDATIAGSLTIGETVTINNTTISGVVSSLDSTNPNPINSIAVTSRLRNFSIVNGQERTLNITKDLDYFGFNFPDGAPYKSLVRYEFEVTNGNGVIGFVARTSSSYYDQLPVLIKVLDGVSLPLSITGRVIAYYI